MYEKKFYTPGVVPTHGIGVTGNKMNLAKGDTSNKISNVLGGNVKKRIKNKSLSKTAHYKNPLRGFSPEVR